MHKHVRASHDRGRMIVGNGVDCIDNNLVFLGSSTHFAIISLRDAHGVASGPVPMWTAAIRGYKSFIRMAVDEVLEHEGR